MQLYSSVSHILNDLIQSSIYEVITVEVKTNENASGASNQDQTDDVSSVTSKARDVTRSRCSIMD